MSLAEELSFEEPSSEGGTTDEIGIASGATTRPAPRWPSRHDRAADRDAFELRNQLGGSSGTTTAKPPLESATASANPVALPLSLPRDIPPPRRTATFKALQQFEGRVLDVGPDWFSAALFDMTDEITEEEAEFDLDEVSSDDRSLVVPGAIFYWSIGYRTERSGERSRTSLIWFRRLPVWGERDLEDVQARVAALRTALDR